MATRTNPLVTAATLASAAAIAVATPAIAPTLTLPTPHALSVAQVQLDTFADVLSVPAGEWSALLFGTTSWGGALGRTSYGAAIAAPQTEFGQNGYVNPWAYFCNSGCTRSGVTGAAYLFFDALINGNGKGINDNANWKVGLVNYYFEPNSTIQIGTGSGSYLNFVSEGNSAATWYALQTTIIKNYPELSVPLAALFYGPHNVTVAYKEALRVVANALLGKAGKLGSFTAYSIYAYLGEKFPAPYENISYNQGLSGVLNYWVDVAKGAAPAASTNAPAAVGTAAATTQPVTTAAAPATVAAAKTTTVSNATTPAAAASVSTPASTGLGSSSAVRTPAVKAAASTPADAPVSTPASGAGESTPAGTTAAPTHPVRDAIENVTKQITSAISGAKAAKAAASTK